MFEADDAKYWTCIITFLVHGLNKNNDTKE